MPLSEPKSLSISTKNITDFEKQAANIITDVSQMSPNNLRE